MCELFSCLPFEDEEGDQKMILILKIAGSTAIIIGCFLIFLPILVNADQIPEKLLEESWSPDFYQRFKVQDFRPEKLKKIKKVVKKVLKPQLGKNVNVTIEGSFDTIDLNPFFAKLQKTFLDPQIVSPPLVIHASKKQNTLLMLKGGFLGFAMSKIGDMIAKKRNDWINKKTDEFINPTAKKQENEVLTFIQSNPTLFALVAVALYLFRPVDLSNPVNLLRDTGDVVVSGPVANALLGKKQSLQEQLFYYLSFRRSYVYVAAGGIFFAFNSKTILKFFKKEITGLEAGSEILKTIREVQTTVSNQLYVLVEKFSNSVLKTKTGSFDSQESSQKRLNKTFLEKFLPGLHKGAVKAHKDLENSTVSTKSFAENIIDYYVD